MKKITFAFFLLISIDAYSLPGCPGMDVSNWDNCFGTYAWRDGRKYVGEYKDNKRHGQGTYTYANGDKYVGNFIDDKEHGQGTYTHGGDKYVGNFIDDKEHGQGTLTTNRGDKYVGNYQDGKKHGQGTFTFSDGERKTGFYMNGEYIPDMCKDMGLSVNSSGYEVCINKLIFKSRYGN